MVEFSKSVTFVRNARFDVILTSVIINKLDFLCKSFCNKSLVGSEISKHKNIIIGTSYSLGSCDVITYVNTITLINLQKFLRKINGEYIVLLDEIVKVVFRSMIFSETFEILFTF